jgi:hypothetical protein
MRLCSVIYIVLRVDWMVLKSLRKTLVCMRYHFVTARANASLPANLQTRPVPAVARLNHPSGFRTEMIVTTCA